MSALRLINETEITNSSYQQVDITNVFSADFDIYKITVDNLLATSQTIYPSLRFLDASGSAITSSVYDLAELEMITGNPGRTFPETSTQNNNRWHEWFMFNGSFPHVTATNVGYIFNPYSSSSYTFGINASTHQSYYHKKIGVFKQSSSITGFALVSTNAYNIENVLVRTYGLRVDS